MAQLDSPPATSLRTPLKATNGATQHGDPSDNEVYDPMISILAAFESLPASDCEAMFEDFRNAAAEKNLRQLLDAISDWAATAELYANPKIRADFEAAQAGRQEVSEWLSEKYK